MQYQPCKRGFERDEKGRKFLSDFIKFNLNCNIEINTGNPKCEQKKEISLVYRF